MFATMAYSASSQACPAADPDIRRIRASAAL